MKKTKEARVRFAPSPTGRLHIGGARTALYNYLIARQTQGQFILRIEDTDRKRYDPEAEPELVAGLQWLGTRWDEGPDKGGPHAPYRQSERKTIYRQFSNQLIEKGNAFHCFCSSKRLEEVRKQQQKSKKPIRYDGHCRTIPLEEARARVKEGAEHVIRFKMPREGSITVTDTLRGDITIENRTLDDTILIKSDGFPVYHLAVVVDDHLMGITHVLRSSEWLSTFPLHGHIYRAFGWKEPVWVHLSLFLKPSGKGKMSKRESVKMAESGKTVFLTDFMELGYLPEAVANWLALMGWSYDDKTEFFTMEDLIDKFSIEKLNPSPAAINFSKLDHFNGLHIRNLKTDDLAMRIKPFFKSAGIEEPQQSKLQKIAPIIQERIKTLDEAVDMAGFFFKDKVTPQPDDLIPKKTTAAQALTAARGAYEILSNLEEITHETAEHPLRDLAAELDMKAGQVFGVIRAAVTGQKVSPPLFESMAIIGRKKILKRLDYAINTLEKMTAPTEP